MMKWNRMAMISAALLLSTPAPSLSAQSRTVRLGSGGPVTLLVGQDVAVDGTKVLVGTQLGAFVVDTAGGAQVELGAPAGKGPVQGWAVGISGNYAVVSHRFASASPMVEDQVYVFDANTGQLLHVLVNPTAIPGGFGHDVAICGNRIVVGSPFDQTLSPTSGAAYIYDAASGQMLHQLLPPDVVFGDRFGSSVAIDGNIALVGAPEFFNGATSGQGIGRVISFDVNSGQQIAELTPPVAEVNGFFGLSVDIDGTTAIVGQPGLDHASVFNAGIAHLFDATTGAFLSSLLPDDTTQVAQFGSSVGLQGTLAACGDPEYDGVAFNTGRTHVFDLGSGQELEILQAPTPRPNSMYGESVAVDAGLVVSGCFFDGPFLGPGAAYVNDRTPDTWYSLGSGQAGANGIPSLTANGSLAAGSPLTVQLSNALPSGIAIIVMGFSSVLMPVKQGFLVPAPDVLFLGLPLDAAGQLSISTSWPAGVPPGTSFQFQAWAPDVVGFSASNAVMGFVP